MQARRFLRKGCETFLALVLDSKSRQVNLEDIPVIKEFPDVTTRKLIFPDKNLRANCNFVAKKNFYRLNFRYRC